MDITSFMQGISWQFSIRSISDTSVRLEIFYAYREFDEEYGRLHLTFIGMYYTGIWLVAFHFYGYHKVITLNSSILLFLFVIVFIHKMVGRIRILFLS